MTSPHAVLIVDADPKGLEALVYGFQGADWKITACPSPETASLLIKASAAHLVVIASRGEHERMHSLVRQLRAKEAWRSLPILVLGPEDLRPTLAESGNVDLLALPAFVRDVLSASELLLASTAATPGEEPCFRGAITGARTLSLVRTMSGLVRSGHLHLERNGRTGEILFHQGELTFASVGPLQAMAAVQHLMVWNDGKLELCLRQVPRRGQLHLSAQDFLLELDRFQRDYAHAMREIGPASTAYAASSERLKQAGGAIPAEVTPVVRLCDGKRVLSDVIDESPFRVLDTVRIVARLSELGVLTRADGKKVTAPLAADEEFLDTARIVGQPWPMPEPIAGLPQGEPAPGPSGAAVAAPVAPPANERPRRQTKEIGVPVSPSGQPGPVPTPAVRRPTPLIVTAPPVAPARAMTPAPVAPPVVTPAAVVPVAPVAVVPTPGPAASPAPVAAPRPAGPVATIMQASGALARPVVVPVGAASAPGATKPLTPVAIPVAPAPAASAPSATATPAASASGAIVRPMAVQASGPNAIVGATQVAGVIESRKAERRSHRTAGEQPRVVIATAPAVPPQTPVAASSPNLPGPAPATPKTPAAASSANLPSPSSPTPAPAPQAAGGGRITGVLETAPSRRTASLATPPPPARIQVDVSLSAPANPEPAQATPPPVVTAPVQAAPPAPGTRVTGEMRTVSSGRTTRPMTKAPAATSSFHIDPSLAARPDATAATPPPRRSDSQRIPGAKRRGTGGFSPIEADFFAREADLYKESTPEPFADLDADEPGKPKGKPGRPNRK
jgi:DNA-binding response OmpR family regulator